MKNEISHIKDDMGEVKVMLKDHITWEETKHQELEIKYANKWTEKVIVGMVITIASGIVLAVINLL